MPRLAKELSALEVKRLRHPGGSGNVVYFVGGVAGLMLQVTPSHARSWLLRVMIGGKRRELGLGSFPEIPLAQARDRAREAKDKIRNGIDPIVERQQVRAQLAAEQRRGMTFSEATELYLAAKLDAFKNSKHRDQWRSTLERYAIPELGPMLVDDLTVQDILRVLDPIWKTKTETASRLRGRIEAVLSWATVSGHRSGDNPARWAGNLKELLPAATKVAKISHQPALQIDDAPRWFASVGARQGIGARALQFAALTASRSQEVRGALWDEIDFGSAMWIVPAGRMKMDREHRVPLTDTALQLLEALPRFQGNPLVFPAPRGGQMTDMTMSAAMKRVHAADVAAGGSGFVDRVSGRPAVPHGLRSTFRDWIAERTEFPGDMAEIALAHKISNAVEASYRRGDMVEKRRAMMAAWADFLHKEHYE
ncbi:integrase arm-type DNA-binding domain-containing protein [Pseudooceanicola nitratireducens]|uniref:tyrosine-type recombinase/integrase n=1 Tax=Pseudooceanicola nitratireducens TaxID=517719 RepID=UPI001C982EB0|nr:integrase arm-type DNA-binding domain-containing protein [Pseudooceanicola nitratireducens]MBY6164894.1 integrase arm-type DNA-binding domain-containing protein [Pseudooceanicola nitratireducens]